MKLSLCSTPQTSTNLSPRCWCEGNRRETAHESCWWCHRFRDTAITNQVRQAKTMAELLDLCQRIGHVNTFHAEQGLWQVEEAIHTEAPAAEGDEANQHRFLD